MKIASATDFGLKPGNSPLLTGILREALLSLRGAEDVVLRFEPGEYHFYPQGGLTRKLCISNHDRWDGHTAAFALEGFDNFVIDGGGSRFIFHTEILPFYIAECRNIRLQNFLMDYARPSYSEGTIVSVSPRQMTVEIDEDKWEWQIKDKCLFFSGENFGYPLHLWLEMDGREKGPAYGTDDLYICAGSQKVGLHPLIEEAGGGRVRFTLQGEERFFAGSRAGNKLVFRHHPRSHPAFYAVDSAGLVLEKIRVCHAGGMGFLAERCRDVSLLRLEVMPDEKNPRCFTAAADAAHFVNCGGDILLEECRFEQQMDDGLNIHGFYSPVVKKADEYTLLLGWGHRDQQGVRLAREGDEAALLDAGNLYPFWRGRFEKVSMQEENVVVRFDRKLPQVLPENTVAENLTLSPKAVIRKCIFRKNRARGILLTCREALVEDCLFETAGAAVYMEGEACYWYESGAAKAVTLRRNRFINCSYIPAWGEAPVTVYPKVKSREGAFYNGKLTLSENEFYCFDERVLFVRGTEQIVLENNRYYRTNKYEKREGARFDIDGCGSFLKDYGLNEI